MSIQNGWIDRIVSETNATVLIQTGVVIEPSQWIHNPGEAVFFRRDTWHYGFSCGSEPLRVLEFMAAEQDWKLCEDNQAGVNSSRYAPGPYSPDEAGVEHFVQWYLKLLQRIFASWAER